MAISLKSNSPYYNRIRAHFAVDPATNEIKELKNNLKITVPESTLLPNTLQPNTGSTTAPFGPSFRTGGSGVNAEPITFPAIPYALDADMSAMLVYNQFNHAEDPGGYNKADYSEGWQFRVSDGMPNAYGVWTWPTTVDPAEGHSCIWTRDVSGSDSTQRFYIDGALDSTTNSSNVNASGISISQIGGRPGFTTCSIDTVHFVIFEPGTVFTPAEAAELHGLLTSGGSNSLISLSAQDTAPTFSGPAIADFSCVAGQAITPRNVAPLFADNGTLVYSKVGTWPAWLALDGATGVISGTPTSTTGSPFSGLKVRATDQAQQSIDSNAFNVTVAAAGSSAGSVTVGPVGNNTGSGAIVSAPVVWSYFPGWRIGDPLTAAPIHGSGTLNSNGQLTAGAGLPSGTSGEFFYARRNNSDPAADDVASARVTVS